jgi:hypothetical protein
MRPELGDAYCNAIEKIYKKRLGGKPDLVCYWFEHARTLLEKGKVKRIGLLATNSIRGGTNRNVLKAIKDTGDIFMAWSDRDWILDGASVRVSMIGFDNGKEETRTLDGISVLSINPDLTAEANVTQAHPLPENAKIAYQGVVLRGHFDMDTATAEKMLTAWGNPNGRPNSDVIRPRMNAMDITRRNSNTFVVDFGSMSIEQAAEYVMPFEYVQKEVYPERQLANQIEAREQWWIHWRARRELRDLISKLNRYILTPRVSKFRLFIFVPIEVIPDSATVAFARDDDYFFGVLHSRVHEVWALRGGTWLGVGNDPRYTPTTTFETFPFPFPPGQEPQDDPRVHAIATAAADLNAKRERALNPQGATPDQIKKLTLTNLYNQRPHWLALAHEALDRAVFAAYGWHWGLTDDEILERLLALNAERQLIIDN